MVPKRKKSTMALMQEDITLGEESASNAPSDAPRRRSERTKSARKAGHGIHLDSKAAEALNAPSQAVRAKLKKERDSNRGGVERAVDGLKEFEGSLQESLKRQILAIKSSRVMNETAADDDLALHPRPIDNTSKSLLSAQQQKLLDREKNLKRGQNPHMPPGGIEDHQAHAAEETGEAEDSSAAKKEGARPPPVNSDYLPLPWKGRLGYVRGSLEWLPHA
jgi:UV DNA damage endonuclease